MMAPRLTLALLASLGAGLLVGCNLLNAKDAAPTEPTPVSLVPISIPVVLPSPTATPAPAPTAAPTPVPTPTPEPTAPPPSSSSCNLPPSNPANPACGAGTQSFLQNLENAITLATQKRPDLFDFNDKRCENCYRVKDVNAYINLVMKNLAAQGLCTLFDGEDLQIKNTNDFNDGYDIITWDNYIRRGAGCYRGTCRPSWF
jgi:hypothetical protein